MPHRRHPGEPLATTRSALQWDAEIKTLKKRIHLTRREISDLEMIGVGAFQPARTFHGRGRLSRHRDAHAPLNGLRGRFR